MKNQTLKLTNKTPFFLSIIFFAFILSCSKEDIDKSTVEPNDIVTSSDQSSIESKDQTLGTREILLNIYNKTPYKMTNPSAWFDSGKLKSGYTFHEEIPSGKIAVTRMKEVDSFEVIYECSGYVNYTINGGTVTIAYSNPDMGKNKIGIGTGGKSVWENIESHDYNSFESSFAINGVSFKATLSCTGGSINNALVSISVLE